MPPAPRFKTNAIRELFTQLRFAPIETRRREMDAAEHLTAEIDASINYPQDFIVYRITGYRPVHSGEPVMLVGEAVVPDLVSMVQRLSRLADLPADYRGREPLDIEAVRDRLGISARTLHRYRRQGLVCHYVARDGGAPRLVCFADALERFLETRRGPAERAARFSRVGRDGERAIYEAARELRQREGLSLNAAARRLAQSAGRSHEAVRAILRRRDASDGNPVFTDRGPLTARDRRVLLRARRWGVPTATLVERFRRSAPALLRATNRARRDRLAALDLSWIDLPTFELAEAETVILSAPPVVAGLDERPLGGDLLDRLARVHAAPDVDEDVEDALVAAYNLLKRRARRAIAILPALPTAAAIDAIETDLAWAAGLKRRLVALAFPATIGAVENYLHRRLPEEPFDRIIEFVVLALRVGSDTVESLDPARGPRLERRAGFDMGRALAARTGDRVGGRAAARHQPGTVRLSESQRRYCPWQRWLDPPAAWRDRRVELDTASRRLIDGRYGWSGGPPRTIAQLADELGSTPSGIAMRLGRAERRLREQCRGES